MPCEVAVAVDLADPRRAEFARRPVGEVDPLGRRRMRGEEVRPLLEAGHEWRPVARETAHRLEEARGRERVVAGPADGLDADRVGLELLLAREGGERPLARGERELAGPVVEHVGHDAADDDRVPRLVLRARSRGWR